MSIAHICDLCGGPWPSIVAKGERHYMEASFGPHGPSAEAKTITLEICDVCWGDIAHRRKQRLQREEARLNDQIKEEK